jgi:hypothetical protein
MLEVSAPAGPRRRGKLNERAVATFGAIIAMGGVLAACQAQPGPSDPVRSAAILGLDGGAVRKLLGEPGLIRRETPAEVWQYRTADCVLDVVLYDNATGPRVAYAEARTSAAEPTPTDACLSDVLTTKQSATS